MWKEIPGTNGNYSANDETGEIRSNEHCGTDGRRLPSRVLRPWVINSGYQAVSLHVNGQDLRRTVHRLVAKTFLPDYSEDLVVNHLDLDRRNNAASNLEMCTLQENLIHGATERKRLGDSVPTKPQPYVNEKYEGKSHPVVQMDPDINMIVGEYHTANEAYQATGIKPAYIRRAANGFQQLAGGYRWFYEEREPNKV